MDVPAVGHVLVGKPAALRPPVSVAVGPPLGPVALFGTGALLAVLQAAAGFVLGLTEVAVAILPSVLADFGPASAVLSALLLPVALRLAATALLAPTRLPIGLIAVLLILLPLSLGPLLALQVVLLAVPIGERLALTALVATVGLLSLAVLLLRLVVPLALLLALSSHLGPPIVAQAALLALVPVLILLPAVLLALSAVAGSERGLRSTATAIAAVGPLGSALLLAARFAAVLEVLVHLRPGLELVLPVTLAATLFLTAVLLVARTGAFRSIVTRLPLLFPAPLLLLGLLTAVGLVALLSAALSLVTALPLAVLSRLLGPVLSTTALLAATVLLSGAAFLSLRPTGFAAVLEVRFTARVRREAALIALLTLASTPSLTAALGLHSRLTLPLVLVPTLRVPLTAAGAVALARLRARPPTRAGLAGRLLSVFGPPRPGRFLPSVPALTPFIGSPALRLAAAARGALEPAAVAVALALVALLAVLAPIAPIALAALVVVPVRFVLSRLSALVVGVVHGCEVESDRSSAAGSLTGVTH
ncbi:hypothetical protein GCM10028856_24500 [Halopiger thermotolerans]